MRLDEVLASVGLNFRDLGLDRPLADTQVQGIALASDDVEEGFIFAALPGYRRHGAEFAHTALSRGACLILTDSVGRGLIESSMAEAVPVVEVSRPRALVAELAAELADHPSSEMTLVGVTGTNGKTTVTHLIQAALQAAGLSCGVIGTLGSRLGEWEDKVNPRTTPEAPDLQRSLRGMKERGANAVAMEVSSIALCEHRVDALTFDVVAFTGLSRDHLDYHGTMEDYFNAKAELFEPGRAAKGVVLVDDEWGERLAATAAIPIETVSIRSSVADWVIDYNGSDGRLVNRRSNLAVTIPTTVRTDFVLANIGLALVVAHSLGVPLQQAGDAIVHARVPGRMELVAEREGISFLVDYAHTPDAIDQVVKAAVGERHARGGRVIVVVGAGGDRDPSKRAPMGRAASSADVVIVTDDNPRSENPAKIRREVLQGVTNTQVLEISERAEAIERAVQSAAAGDLVLILGKGHEATQEFSDHVVEFDDRSVLMSSVDRRFGEGKKGALT